MAEAAGDGGGKGKLPGSALLASPWAKVTFAILMVLGVATLLFNEVLKRSTAEVEGRYARSLARLSREVEGRYGTFLQVVESTTAMVNAADRKAEGEAAAGDRAPFPAAEQRAVDTLKAALLPSYGGIVEACRGTDPAQLSLCVARESQRAGRGPLPGLEITPCPSPATGPQHVATFVGDRRFLRLAPAAREGDAGGPVCGRVAVSRLFPPGDLAKTSAPSGGEPDELLLVWGDEVVHQADRSGLRVASLPASDPKQGHASRMLRDFAVGAGKFRAFLQPTAVRVVALCSGKACEGEGTASKALTLVGLVNEARLAEESRNISPEWYFWGVLLMGFAVLSLPLGKLWFVGRRGRLGRFDVGLLAASSIAATLLSVVLVLALVGHSRLERRLDLGLADVASRLSAAVSRQMLTASAALQDFSRGSVKIREALVTAERTPGAGVADVLRLCEGGRVLVPADGAPTGREAPVCEVVNVTDGVARKLTWGVAFWAGTSGRQQLKYTPREHATPPIDVSARGYFQRARAERVTCFTGPGECPREPGGDFTGLVGAPEVVRSATTGDVVLVMARPTYAAVAPHADGPPAVDGVMALEVTLSELDSRKEPRFEPILPPGFQVGIVDESGRVMLHTRNGYGQGQDVFEDVDDAEELRALVAARATHPLDLRYAGTPTRAHVQYVPHVGWSVIVLAPRSVVSIPTSSTAILTLVGFGGLLVVGLGALAIVLFSLQLAAWRRGEVPAVPTARPTTPSLDVRPRASRTRAYATAGCFMTAWALTLCVFAFASTSILPPSIALVFAALGGVVALSLVPGIGIDGPLAPLARVVLRVVPRWLRPRDREQDAPYGWRDSLPITYALCVFGLAGTFVVTPATVLFAGSYDHVAEQLVRAEDRHFTTALDARPDCRDAPGRCPEVLGFSRDKRAPASTPDERERARTCLLWPASCVLDLLPPLRTFDGESARIYREPRWARAGFVRSHVEYSPDAFRTAPPARDAASVPLLQSRDYDPQRLLLVILAFLMFLGTSHFVMFHSLGRLFFLSHLGYRSNVPEPTSAELEMLWEASTPDERSAIGQLARDGYANPEPSTAALLRRWCDRGLLDPDTFTLTSRAVRAFVEERVSEADLVTLAGTDGGSVWSKIKVPLVTGVALLVAVITSAAPDLMTAGAVGPGIALGLPAALRILTAIATWARE